MRKSVHKDDPGYDKDACKYKVFLDEKEVFHCFTADEEEGKVWVYDRDENGFILNEDKASICVKVLSGDVKIILDKEYNAH